MKTSTGSLATFLASRPLNIVYADLYTITLNGGSVIRWASSDVGVTYSGYSFAPGPPIMDNGVQSKRGIQVGTLDILIYADATTTINGVPVLTFIRQSGLDGATIRVDRVMGSNFASGLAGGYIRFSGRISEIKDLTKTSVTLSCSNWLELLNVNMPTNVISASCINTLFGAGCGLSKASYAASGTVGSGANGASTFSSGLTAHGADYYDLGYVVFTSGANNGVNRTIKTQDVSGNITVMPPLPAAPSTGDTFTAYPGCLLTQATCHSKFNNLANYRGFPYVPPPETAT